MVLIMDEFQISVEETSKKLKEGKILLIDVREQDEARIAKIEGSKLIPLRDLPAKTDEIRKLLEKASASQAFEKSLSKNCDKEVVVYCHHGYRSSFGAEFLRKNGIKARNMAGGIDEWSKKIDKKVP